MLLIEQGTWIARQPRVGTDCDTAVDTDGHSPVYGPALQFADVSANGKMLREFNLLQIEDNALNEFLHKIRNLFEMFNYDWLAGFSEHVE